MPEVQQPEIKDFVKDVIEHNDENQDYILDQQEKAQIKKDLAELRKRAKGDEKMQQALYLAVEDVITEEDYQGVEGDTIREWIYEPEAAENRDRQKVLDAGKNLHKNIQSYKASFGKKVQEMAGFNWNDLLDTASLIPIGMVPRMTEMSDLKEKQISALTGMLENLFQKTTSSLKTAMKKIEQGENVETALSNLGNSPEAKYLRDIFRGKDAKRAEAEYWLKKGEELQQGGKDLKPFSLVFLDRAKKSNIPDISQKADQLMSSDIPVFLANTGNDLLIPLAIVFGATGCTSGETGGETPDEEQQEQQKPEEEDTDSETNEENETESEDPDAPELDDEGPIMVDPENPKATISGILPSVDITDVAQYSINEGEWINVEPEMNSETEELRFSFTTDTINAPVTIKVRAVNQKETDDTSDDSYSEPAEVDVLLKEDTDTDTEGDTDTGEEEVDETPPEEPILEFESISLPIEAESFNINVTVPTDAQKIKVYRLGEGDTLIPVIETLTEGATALALTIPHEAGTNANYVFKTLDEHENESAGVTLEAKIEEPEVSGLHIELGTEPCWAGGTTYPVTFTVENVTSCTANAVRIVGSGTSGSVSAVTLDGNSGSFTYTTGSNASNVIRITVECDGPGGSDSQYIDVTLE